MKRRNEIAPYNVGIAAEGFAAGMLAHAGYRVLVQYGANQPDYDLVAEKDGRSLRVSVKGTQREGWGLTQSYLKNADYHKAADDWLKSQSGADIFMLVCLHEVPVGGAPRVWVVRPKEIAAFLKKCRSGHGVTTLFVDSGTYLSGVGKGCRDVIPDVWEFSQRRIDTV